MVTLLLAILMQAGTPNAVEFFDYIRGERLTFTVTTEALARSPSWPQNELSPPLAPRRAIEIAMKQLGQLYPDADRWRFSAVSLRPVGDQGKWVYLVAISEPPPRFDGGVHGAISLVVLMDGTTITPKRERWALN